LNLKGTMTHASSSSSSLSSSICTTPNT